MTKLQKLVDDWIEERPFLRELGQFHLAVHAILENIGYEETVLENLNLVKDEFKRGIPLLKCESLVVPILPVSIQAFKALTDLAEDAEVPIPFRENCQKLKGALAEDSHLAESIVVSLVKDDYSKLAANIEDFQLNKGVVTFLGWTAIAHALHPYLSELMKWEDEQGWNREYCPTCGALPNMAQLKRSHKGRRRHLVCGCCRTTWIYKRIICPYCHNEDQEQMVILEVDEEDDIRIDVCKSCNGYIKVYTNQGEEEIALADWSTIHLDILVKGQGYQKMGTHLLEI